MDISSIHLAAQAWRIPPRVTDRHPLMSARPNYCTEQRVAAARDVCRTLRPYSLDLCSVDSFPSLVVALEAFAPESTVLRRR